MVEVLSVTCYDPAPVTHGRFYAWLLARRMFGPSRARSTRPQRSRLRLAVRRARRRRRAGASSRTSSSDPGDSDEPGRAGHHLLGGDS